MLGAGVFFQGSYSYFDGGFTSQIIVWFGVIPFLAGICDNKRAVYILGFLVTGVSLVFLLMSLNGYPFPSVISPDGRWYSHVVMAFGWIFLSFFAIVLYLKEDEARKKEMLQANQNTNDLLKILIHDISNPLSVADSSADLMQIKQEPILKSKNMTRISSSLKNINQIVKKVKEMHAIQSGKVKVSVQDYCLYDLVGEVENLFIEKLGKKAQDLA